MTIIFNAKTNEAYHIKILIELLANNIKIAHFELDQTGIKLCMMDAHRKILINLKLCSENFTLYKYTGRKTYLGINLNHFHKMLKSIKKKDVLQFIIDDTNSNKLEIRVIPKEKNRVTTSYITIQTVQELDIDLPTGYTKSIIVSSSEFQKMIKDMSNIGNIVNISSKHFQIKFTCETGGILERSVDFGEVDNIEDENAPNDNFSQEYMTEQLLRITKIAGLHTHVKIFPGKPLLFNTKIGNLGDISIYIKSKEQINDEKCNVVNDYDSS